MKQCPSCQETFDDKVDFCFSDGTPLVAMSGTPDPTAVPGPASAEPEPSAPAKAAGGGGRRQRRGMFGRPSVADMLSVAEPAAVPMAGAGAGAGPANPPPSAATPSKTPPPIRPIVQARVEVPDPADQATDLVEPQEFADAETLIDEPVGEGLPIGDSAAIAVEAPQASAAADLPDLPTDLSEPHEWPTAASNEATSLEDSWFGDNFETDATEIDEPGDAFDIPEAASVPTDEGATDIFDVPDARARSRDKNATAATDPTELFEVPKAASVAVDVPEPRSVDTLEVPEPRFSAASTDVPEAGGAQSEGIGFADEEDFFGDNADEAQAGLSGFSEDSGLDDDLGFGSDAGFSDDVGFGDAADAFSDDSWDVGSSASQEVPIPKKMIFGGIGVLAAAILLTAVLSGGSDDAPIAAPAPAPQAAPVAAAPPPPPPPPPVVPEPETAPEVEVPAAEAVEPEKPVAEAVAARTTAPEPPAVKAAKVAKATKAAKAAKAERIRSGGAAAAGSPWTGNTAAAPAPAPTTAANPWGAPAETPSRGRLTITTDPAGAMVFVGDRRIGKSPTQTEVSYGTHNIRVEMKEHKTSSRTVNVQASEVSVPFRLELTKVIGRCMLLGNPGSEVLMNGKRVGTLPATVDCASGTHGFKVTPPGGTSFQISRSVNVQRPGDSVTVMLNP